MKYAVILGSALATCAWASTSTVTATEVFTIPCTATPLPIDCIANSWSGIVEFTITPGDLIHLHDEPTDLPIPTSTPTSFSTGKILSNVPSISGPFAVTTMVTATTVFTIACTASPLPEDCEANSWSNTLVEITATPGRESLTTYLALSCFAHVLMEVQRFWLISRRSCWSRARGRGRQVRVLEALRPRRRLVLRRGGKLGFWGQWLRAWLLGWRCCEVRWGNVQCEDIHPGRHLGSRFLRTFRFRARRVARHMQQARSQSARASRLRHQCPS
ncbi:hypothetical protein DPSP01_013446 [Paraphaeosphaeria sporulosa]